MFEGHTKTPLSKMVALIFDFVKGVLQKYMAAETVLSEPLVSCLVRNIKRRIYDVSQNIGLQIGGSPFIVETDHTFKSLINTFYFK